ncbi:protein of unknown function DUF75 [Beutenbergia cavernae DSM 12333]|uniref:PAC2 family protein n=1 Tax=Beutenbergia cavernae (strain ATCC BAA-8 / DSM 12333 / CCUG 43141 / JCM 11478 / NBRC 16432 / NCIMB 13614 / HKI 0122) TaxID=471853 RepID=C5BW76_BEUC1|nr:PAC2 family protein [Beutenbergia cavernae]ACQ80677.1 protein of unknown function DUF75 [Beutenbergia cavernae DSM 12333]
MDARDLYTSEHAEGARVLVHALQGSMDAGHAGALLAQHLLTTLPATRVATFDVDELLDYRSRRPAMTFEATTWTSYDDPVLAVDLVRTPTGEGVLLLHGPEPDLRWERFTTAVRTLVEDLGVETTVGVHGIPMGVPHTRPTTVTAHATRPELLEGRPSFVGTIQVPGSASSLLELRLGEAGHDAMGFAANVPHYLAQAEYPQAAAELVRQINSSTGLDLPVGELEASASSTREEIDRQVAESDEIGAVVHALEQQYDAFSRGLAAEDARTLLAQDRLPSADELGAEFEAFLAEHAPGEPDAGGDADGTQDDGPAS